MSRLRDLLDETADSLGAERIVEADGTVVYRRGSTVLAIDDASGTDFQLRPDVASAALRTPAVAPSPRGAAWVRFSPADLGRTVRDRARAWLEFAWRQAEP